jgi:alpha,alpha-trehalase
MLALIQRSRVFSDAKTFVDMPTRRPLRDVLWDFDKTFQGRAFHHQYSHRHSITDHRMERSELETGASCADDRQEDLESQQEREDNALEEDIKDFVVRNFDPPGTEMRVLLPSDWTQQPAFLSRIRDKDLVLFARAVHEKWRSLLRSFDQSSLCPECVCSSFKLPAPFIIPGGRFREFYYWDSFWILEGLYVSEMCQTARGMVDNMLAIVDTFGFVPNGARIYYLNRSQPPMLPMIIERYLQNCVEEPKRETFLQTAFPLLQREHAWWLQFRADNATGLAVYRPNNHHPRPESFVEDEISHRMCNRPAGFYQDIAGGAESGWDFSSRWFGDYRSIGSIRTSDLVPVDLNSILYRNELLLSDFAGQLGMDQERRLYADLANKRAKAMQRFLWNGTTWLDYDGRTGRLCLEAPSQYISTLAPMWFGVPPLASNDHDLLLRDVRERLFNHKGGVPTSTAVSAHQWDFPNVWAPMQHLVIRHLQTVDPQEALKLAQKWINSTYCGYHKHGMHHPRMLIIITI